jgi:hypothetical protein
MKRFALLVSAVSATLVVAAAPAFAKGEGTPIFATAVITGPGLPSPIVASGKMSAWGPGDRAAAGVADGLIRAAGLGAGSEEGWYVLAPDPATLGPGFDVTYYFEAPDLFATTVPLHQVIYPYAPDRPLVYTVSGQRFFGSKIGEWWSAPPTLLTWLVAQGLPATPPAPAPAAPRPLALPEPPAAEAFPWAVVFAVTGLLAMVVTAAVAGRRAQIRLNRSA